MIVTIPIKTEKDIATPGPTVLVLGYFDGIHLGHQKLFEIHVVEVFYMYKLTLYLHLLIYGN